MNTNVPQFVVELFEKANLEISEFEVETEGRSYSACQYNLNGEKIYSRTAKITPKKIGQFVTCWKRNSNKITEPFNENESLDYLIIIVENQYHKGLFVFPKEILIEHGIISNQLKQGKRGFRVYPNWDLTKSKQALLSQNWQLNYFFDCNEAKSVNLLINLFANDAANKF